MNITRGTEAQWTIPIYTNGVALELASVTITSTAQDTSGNALYTNFLTTDGSGAVTGSENMALGPDGYTAGVVVETIPAAETAAFAAGSYVVQFSVELVDGSFLYPIPTGILTVTDPASTSTTTVRRLIHGITRRDLRRMVAQSLYDYHDGTDVTGGQTGQITDYVNFARETDYFSGMQILFTNPASPHYGSVTTVTRSDGPNRTIYFEPPLASNTIPGETVEMVNFRGRGAKIIDYNAAINRAIAIARESHAMTPMSITAETAFVRTSPYIPIPDEFTHVSGVEYVDRQGYTRMLPARATTIDRMSGMIRIGGTSAGMLHGLYPAVRGYVAPPLLETDDDRVSIEAEWLMNEVKAQILERNVASGMPIGSQDRIYLQERTEAGGKRPMIITRVLPNTVRIR